MNPVLAGRYELMTRPVGQGPHGTVWRAKDTGTRQVLAIKLLHQHVAARAGVLQRFLRERSVLASRPHPILVGFSDLVPVDDTLALTMELVPGENLRDRLDRAGPMPLAVTAHIVAELAEAVAATHAAGIIHCGIQPTNILLTNEGGVRLTDCRVACLAGGPPTVYTAPEASKGGPYLPAGDVYALAAVLHEMLTISVVSTAGIDRQVEPLRLIIQDCLRADPATRPTASETAALLHSVRTELAEARAHRTTVPWPTPPARRRNRMLIAAVAAATVLATGGTSLALYQRRSADPQVGAPASPTAADPQVSLPGSAPADQTLASATAFVHDWFKAFNTAIASGDISRVEQVSSPTCAACRAALDAVGAIYEGGGSIRGGAFAVREVRADSFFSTTRPSLYVVFDRAPRSELDSGGQQLSAQPAGSFLTAQVVLEWSGDGWRMQEILSTTPIF